MTAPWINTNNRMLDPDQTVMRKRRPRYLRKQPADTHSTDDRRLTPDTQENQQSAISNQQSAINNPHS